VNEVIEENEKKLVPGGGERRDSSVDSDKKWTRSV